MNRFHGTKQKPNNVNSNMRDIKTIIEQHKFEEIKNNEIINISEIIKEKIENKNIITEPIILNLEKKDNIIKEPIILKLEEKDILDIPEIIQKPILKRSKTIGILKPFVWN